jgi:hypothetical protein
MTMEMTMATMGRLMKLRNNLRRYLPTISPTPTSHCERQIRTVELGPQIGSDWIILLLEILNASL